MNKEKLWLLLKRIPRGKVTTYKQLGEALNTSPRAVGAALRTNPFPDKIPCYKVVKSDGRIGGYLLGRKEKTRRLEKDGLTIRKNKITNFTEKLYTYQT